MDLTDEEIDFFLRQFTPHQIIRLEFMTRKPERAAHFAARAFNMRTDIRKD